MTVTLSSIHSHSVCKHHCSVEVCQVIPQPVSLLHVETCLRHEGHL